jgi:hypothetical protein
MHHMRQWGTTFQIPECLCLGRPIRQPSISSLTCHGITQDTPKGAKTVSHNSFATRQRIKWWSIDSPSTFHMQHQLITIRFRFLKLSAVRILPKATVHVKKDTPEGTLGFQMPFHGNFIARGGLKQQ